MHVQCVTFETPRRDSYLSQKAFNFDVLQSEDSATVATGLDAALIQINATREILEALQRHLTQRSVRNRALSEVLQSSARIHWHDKKLWRPRSLLDACVVLPLQVTFLLLRCVFGVMLSGLNLPLWNTPSGVRRVKHLSTVLQQIERRLVHVCRWPLLLSRYRQPQKNGAVAAAAFVSFFSSVTQVWVDVLVGWLCGIVMMRHASLVLETTHVFGQVLHIDVLRSHTEWLMGLPAGMKLNAPLNHFLGSLALHVFDMWNTVTTFVTPLEPMLLAALGIVGGILVSEREYRLNDKLSRCLCCLEPQRLEPRSCWPPSSTASTCSRRTFDCCTRHWLLSTGVNWRHWLLCGDSFAARRKTSCATASIRSHLRPTS
ncbi:MAG: hypothetical protein MHM6MM_005183 [Cercozoa sp. M6MM]